MATQVLVIDDDHELNSLLASYLGKNSLKVSSATDPEAGMKLLRKLRPDAVILDVMLPGKDGFALCREIRAESRVPVLMLTARGDLTDRVVGLEIGADDYLPKPFEPRELLARLRSILRRASGPEPKKGSLKCGSLMMDLGRRIVSLKGRELGLSSGEFDMLRHFLSNPGIALDREKILEAVHAESSEAFNRSVDLAVSRLRAKLGDSGKKPKYIKTIWGTGYMFTGEVTHHAA
jgi:two-component system phosphate regulon response regulator OmpR